MIGARSEIVVIGRGCRQTPEAKMLREELVRALARKRAVEKALRAIAEYAGLPESAEPGVIALHVCAKLSEVA